MKRTLIVLALLVSMFVYGQENVFVLSVESYTPFNVKGTYNNGRFETTFDWGETKHASMYMALDYGNAVFSVNNQAHTKLHISSGTEGLQSYDSDGDRYTIWEYEATDQDRDPCVVNIVMYQDINIIRMFIIYEHFGVVYNGNIQGIPYGARFKNDDGTDKRS